MRLCKKQDKRGVAILDGLRMCFTATPTLVQNLSAIQLEESYDIGKYILIRESGKNFSHVFSIQHIVEGKRQLFGQLKFGLKNNDLDDSFVWVWIENRVLYNEQELKKIHEFVATLNLEFHNFTLLDISTDYKKSVVSLIRKLYKDSDNNTIINGKTIKDRKKVIKELTFRFSATLDKLVNPTIYVKQKEAIKDKSKGITIMAYNKLAEIKTTSKKQHILNYYEDPQALHRLEVHVNREQILHYGKRINIQPSIDWIFDKEILKGMFFYNLQAVIRFTRKKGNKKIDWEKILSFR